MTHECVFDVSYFAWMFFEYMYLFHETAKYIFEAYNSWRWYFLTFEMKLTKQHQSLKSKSWMYFSNPYMFVMNTMNTSQKNPHECICHMYSFNVSHECSLHSKMTLQNTKGVVFMNVFVAFFAIFLKWFDCGFWVVLCFVQSLVTTCYAPGLVNNSNLFCHGHKGGWRDGEAIKRLL